ncbi:MAG: SpoIVB peptidase [Lachnospiraceae bacterium]|nr:SpoIVB peptidase [Lachnospiraceae bacterium]
MKKYKICLYIAFICSVCMGIVLFEYLFYRQIPDVIYLKDGTVEEFEFSFPVTGEITEDVPAVETFGNTQTPLNESDEMIAYQNQTKSEQGQYIWKIKLFGMFPLKDIKLEVVEDMYVYPVGCPVGIYVKSEGVLVAGLGNVKTTPTTEECPCNHILQAGDYILEVNGQAVSLKNDIINLVRESQGNPVVLTIRRNGEISQVEVMPVLNLEGVYQIGVWVRDSAQGIGTLTYIDEDGCFGALGHGINDIDTAKLLDIDYGGLYETEIVSVKKGSTGEPGEISGVIRFLDTAKIGSIEKNTANGIYGKALEDETVIDFESVDKYPIALKQEIHLGDAQMAFMSGDEWNLYDIEITNIDYSQSEGNRGLVIKVTDPELIDKTGGIIQGMSGSPILQDDKIIGAVTHVFVNDPTKGYGIFIENMLKH